jgi:glycosyltransferase involved in cell wall biosynthesis
MLSKYFARNNFVKETLIKSLIGVKHLYVRNFFPWFSIIFFFIKLKRNKIKLYLEIPTWPYFFEQIFSSRFFILASIKYILEYLYIILFHNIFNKILFISSNRYSIKFNNFVEIYNGNNSFDVFFEKSLKTGEFQIVGVGTLYKYHGYDLIIKMIPEYLKSKNPLKIKLIIVGNGPEITNLKNLTHRLQLHEYVFFPGLLDKIKLIEIYKSSNLALGTLKLYYRFGNVDSAIKNIEYLSYYTPFVTSGMLSKHSLFFDFYYKINFKSNLSDLIMFSDHFFKSSSHEKVLNLLNENYTWKNIYKGIFD